MAAIYANAQGQLLAAHSVLVGRLAQALAARIYTERGDAAGLAPQLIGRLAYWAGLLHDVGKLDPYFQHYMQGLVQQAPSPGEAWSPEDGVQIPPADALPKTAGGFAHLRHQEVSWLLCRLFLDTEGFRQAIGVQAADTAGTSRMDYVEYAIYWHHAQPLRNDRERGHYQSAENMVDALAANGWSLAQAQQALQQLLVAMGQWEPLPAISGVATRVAGLGTPRFKHHYAKDMPVQLALQHEAYKTAIRACVVSADRMVSRLSAAQLMVHLQQGTLPSGPAALAAGQPPLPVYQEIERMVAHYAQTCPGSRTDAQHQAARQLSAQALRQGMAVLQGPAGSGKSKVFLQALALCAQTAKGAQRILVFVPRTAIGEGLFDELIHTYRVRSRVELLLGTAQRWSAGDGQVIDTPQAQQGSGDLVITTIDQLCKTMLCHERLDWITELACSHVVFDEFHELADIPGISLLFREVMRLRTISQGVSLLVSATPNPYLLQQIAPGLRASVALPALHSYPYTLLQQPWPAEVYRGAEHTQDIPWMAQTELVPGAFVISNTAALAQACSVARHRAGQSVVCFHSRYTPHDKQALLQRVMTMYGKQAPDATARPVLVSGPIVQASLNISTTQLHTEATTAENFLQRVGRCNRFGEAPHAHIHYCWAVHAPSGALANARLLGKLYQGQRTAAFTSFMRQQLPPQAQVTQQQLYALYTQFHQTDAARSAYAADEAQVLDDSRKLFQNHTFDPVRLPVARQASNKAQKGQRLASRSLRGRSYFVLPVKLHFQRDALVAMQLQWGPQLAADQLMTDPLNLRDLMEQSLYQGWSQKASSVLDWVRLKVPERELKKVAAQAKKQQTWEGLRYQALHRDHPVLISSSQPHEESFYYLQIDDLLIGLVHARRLRNAAGWDFLRLL